MRTSFKMLTALLILLVAILIFTLNTVQATEETQEISEEEILNLIPDTLNLDILESQALDRGLNNDFEIDNLICNQLKTIIEKEEIRVAWDAMDFSDFHKAIVEIYDDSNKLLGKKELNIKFSNTDDYNAIDEQYVKNKYENISNIYSEYNIEELEEEICTATEGNDNFYEKQIRKTLNDSSVKFYFIPRGGDIGCIYNFCEGTLIIAKNDVVYLVKHVVKCIIKPIIIIPNSIEDTEGAYIDYATPIVLEHLEHMFEGSSKKSFKKGNTKDEYIITIDDGNILELPIILRKAENKVEVDRTTNVKLDTTTDVVPKDTVMEVEPIEEGEKFEEIKEILEKAEVKKFKIFDITLTSKGVKIQPNGKVKISIPIPNDFNSGKLVVYRIEENGRRIGYTVEVYEENNLLYARFETNHFSNYVLAEGELIEENDVGELKGELDDTPKTGVTDFSYYILSITIISAIGTVLLKKKDK